MTRKEQRRKFYGRIEEVGCAGVEIAKLDDRKAVRRATITIAAKRVAAVERRKYLRVSQNEVEDWFRLSLGRHRECRHCLSCRFGEISK